MPFADLLPSVPDRRRRWAAILLAVALTLHDLEEAIGYPLRRTAIEPWLPWAPPAEAFWAALVAVTGLGVSVAVWAGGGPPSRGKALALRVLALVLLVNVVVPHVPAAWLLGGYAPGVITAVALNLPAGVLALVLLARDGP